MSVIKRDMPREEKAAMVRLLLDHKADMFAGDNVGASEMFMAIVLVNVTCVCGIGMPRRHCIALSCNKSMYHIVCASCHMPFSLKCRTAKPPGDARATTFWSCSSLNGYLIVVMNPMVAPASHVGANTVGCGLHCLLNYFGCIG